MGVIGAIAGIVGAVASVASGVASIVSQSKAAAEQAEMQAKMAEEAAALGAKNRALIEQETAEALRRTELAQRKQSSQAKALAAASGFVSDTGSFDLYMTELEQEQQAELEWIKRSGASKADISAQQTQYNVQQIKSQPTTRVEWGGALGSIVGGIQQGVGVGQDQGWIK